MGGEVQDGQVVNKLPVDVAGVLPDLSPFQLHVQRARLPRLSLFPLAVSPSNATAMRAIYGSLTGTLQTYVISHLGFCCSPNGWLIPLQMRNWISRG